MGASLVCLFDHEERAWPEKSKSELSKVSDPGWEPLLPTTQGGFQVTSLHLTKAETTPTPI